LYDQFSISDEADKYRLFLTGPVNGTLGKRERERERERGGD
jgi:hypothetical protein